MIEQLPGTFSLADEIDRFHPGTASSGRRAETLVKTDRMRVVLMTMLKGTTLQDHSAPGPITIHAIRGRFSVTSDGMTHDLPDGSLIAIGPGILHAVHAVDDGAFLLTISWPPATEYQPANPGDDQHGLPGAG